MRSSQGDLIKIKSNLIKITVRALDIYFGFIVCSLEIERMATIRLRSISGCSP